MDEPSGEKPKLHIDEDWKSQAQAEKERLEREKAAREPASAASAPQPAGSEAAGSEAVGQAAASKAEATADDLRHLPPPTFEVLITTLATQAMVLLGQIANPLTGKAEIDLPQAKHFIDSLGMLEGKTAGNRTPQESKLLDTMLHELRMVYVHVSAQKTAE